MPITFTNKEEAAEYKTNMENEGHAVIVIKKNGEYIAHITGETKSIYKDVQHGRTTRGSLISKTNDRVYMEILNPGDMEIVGKLLTGLDRAGIHYEYETKKVYSPRDKGYVNAIVISYEDTRQLPPGLISTP